MKIGYLVKMWEGYTQTKTDSEVMKSQLLFLKKNKAGYKCCYSL